MFKINDLILMNQKLQWMVHSKPDSDTSFSTNLAILFTRSIGVAMNEAIFISLERMISKGNS